MALHQLVPYHRDCRRHTQGASKAADQLGYLCDVQARIVRQTHQTFLMWPTFYIPSLASPLPPSTDCWNYLPGSGTTERGPNADLADDPDITFPVTAGNTYRVLGRVSFVTGEIESKRTGGVKVAWGCTGTVQVMQRSTCQIATDLLPVPPTRSAYYIDNTEATWETASFLPQHPVGDTRPFYVNLFVDLYITAVTESGIVSLRWGTYNNVSASRAKLTTNTLVLVKEYTP